MTNEYLKEVKSPKVIEIEEKPEKEKIDLKSIKRISKADSFKGYILGNIQKCRNDKNKELEILFREILKFYNKFHPEHTKIVPLKPSKGKSSMKVIENSDCFEIIEPRKRENEYGEIEIFENSHKITREELNKVKNVISNLQLYKKYKTRDIAQEYCKINEILVDSEGRNFFDDKGFLWFSFFGDRTTYLLFHAGLQVLDFYGVIEYYKSGHIEKLKDNFEV